ncbi:MAG: hypothetical protein MMC33_006701 [Icmadophila ericetorum]|nr:hypothetical protein [Icmadophila ericetorum]
MPNSKKYGTAGGANRAIGGVPVMHYLDFKSRGRLPEAEEDFFARSNPAKTLPIIESSGKILPQSYAILRQFSRLLGKFDGEKEETGYFINAVWRTLFMQAFFAPTSDHFERPQKGDRLTFLKALELKYGQSPVSGGPFVLGKELSYADIVIYQSQKSTTGTFFARKIFKDFIYQLQIDILGYSAVSASPKFLSELSVPALTPFTTHSIAMHLSRLLPFLPFLSIANGRVAPMQLGKAPLKEENLSPANVTTITVYDSDPFETINILTIVTPSPGAGETLITAQSQIATSYVPQLTACPLAFNSTPYYYKRQAPRTAASPNVLDPLATFPFYPLPPFPTSIGPCSTLYSPTITPICYSTITPLGGVPSVVTDCTQKIAFSTNYGLYNPLDGTAEEVATTYFADWNRVITGVPLGLVDAVLCPPTTSCTTITESWYTEIIETTSASSSTINVNIALTGPQEVLIPPYFTFTITGTDPATISLSTTIAIPQIAFSTLLIQETLTTGPSAALLPSSSILLPIPTLPAIPTTTTTTTVTFPVPSTHPGIPTPSFFPPSASFESSAQTTITLANTLTKTKTLTLTLTLESLSAGEPLVLSSALAGSLHYPGVPVPFPPEGGLI